VKRRIIIWDTETNGKSGKDSVLSIAALRVEFTGVGFVGTGARPLQRFYFPMEDYNDEAIGINRLTEAVITEKRTRSTSPYPRYFMEDKEFHEYLRWAELMVAHNVTFDRKFLDAIRFPVPATFCTMLAAAPVVREQYYRGGGWKWPKLEKVAAFYDIPFDKAKAHDSYYDVRITFQIMRAMLDRGLPALLKGLGVPAVTPAEVF